MRSHRIALGELLAPCLGIVRDRGVFRLQQLERLGAAIELDGARERCGERKLFRTRERLQCCVRLGIDANHPTRHGCSVVDTTVHVKHTRAMLSLVHRLAAPLSRFVDHLWWFSDVPAHEKERIIPCGTFELVVNLADDEFRIYDAVDSQRCTRFAGAMVSGAYSHAFVIDTREHASVIGAHFKPGGALPFLSGMSLDALADSHVELETLWGRRARVLREQLCLATSATRRFQILEQALLERLSDPFEHDPAACAALQLLSRGRKVREVAAELAVSHRKLIEVFTAEIGLTPKLFARVTRFQRAVALAQSAREPDWSELALESGYFDQSHLIRDFNAFSGLSPAVFRRQRNLPVKDHHVAIPGPADANSSNTLRPVDSRLVATRHRASATIDSHSRER